MGIFNYDQAQKVEVRHQLAQTTQYFIASSGLNFFLY